VNSKAEISGFRVTPVYDTQTGRLVSIGLEYQLDGSQEQIAGTELTLKVFYEGELLEEMPLLSLNHLQSEGNSDSLSYSPSAGWKTGLYSFQVGLYEGDSIIQSTEQAQFTVTPEAIAAVVSWKTLGIIIGTSLILAGIVVAAVLIRRRDMLRG
jgi:hypothetical protein